MKKFFEQAIKNINELMDLRYREISLLTQLNKNKDASALQFKIKNYKIWLNLLNTCLTKNIEIKDKQDILDIKLSSKSLETKLIELLEVGEIKDLEEARQDISNLEKDLQSDSLFNSRSSEPDYTYIEQEEPIKEKEKGKDKEKEKEKGKEKETIKKVKKIVVAAKGEKVDTSKIEAQPKILADESRPKDPRGAAIFDLRYIYGIGPKNAEKLFDQGITLERLLDDWAKWIKKDAGNAILMPEKRPFSSALTGLSKSEWDKLSMEKQHNMHLDILNRQLSRETEYLKKLNSHQIMGVKYFYDITQKIPREEVQRSEKLLKNAAKHMNADLQITLCGSYRRGRAKSGDIDCLITHPDIKTIDELDNYPINLLSKYVEFLTKLDFLVDHLTDNGRSKYMGFCIIPSASKNPIARRIDIRFIPYDSYGAAILYFTGSKTFNTQMRSFALGQGYSLNEYGLKKLKDDILIPCKTEEEVFQILKYPYKKPEERDI
jgi:DNA polymerase/3'-5' exonuclease PolX